MIRQILTDPTVNHVGSIVLISGVLILVSWEVMAWATLRGLAWLWSERRKRRAGLRKARAKAALSIGRKRWIP